MTAPAVEAPARPASPFRGLRSYREADAAFFFGRDEEIEVVIANLEARRLTLLYGASGVGKSSLLGAGVVHALLERARRNLEEIGTPEFVPVYFADWRDDPLPALLEAIRNSVSAVLGEPARDLPPSARLDEALELWSGQARADILIVLDQFEEYLSYHGREQGPGTLVGELPAAVNRPHLHARFLLSIRDDALAKLDRFKLEIPTLFGTYLRLRHLKRESARDAIRRPIDEYNALAGATDEAVDIEQELVEAVLDQVRAGRVVLEQGGRGVIESDEPSDAEARVETAYLQLVMTRVWQTEARQGSRLLRRSTLDELGGAKTIVLTHLDEALSRFSPAEQDLVADVFHYLVTPSGTKIAHAVADLAAYVDRPADDIEEVLERLSGGGTRILRPVTTGDGPQRYEIFHDVLAAAVLDWRARHVQGRLQRDKEAAEAHARAERQLANAERRRARRFRALAVALAIFMVAGTAALALIQWRRANERSARDDSRLIAASAHDLLDTRLDLAIPLALEAFKRAKTFEARSTLAAVDDRTARLVRLVHPAERVPIYDVAFEPGGDRVVTAGKRGLAVWDRSGRRVALLRKGHEVTSIAFSPRGDVLASADRGDFTLWNTRTWQATWHTTHITRGSGSLSISADGKWLAVGSFGGYALWRISAGQAARAVGRAYNSGSSATFSPTDPNVLAVVGDTEGQNVELWNVRRPSRPIARGPAHVDVLAFSPDGKLLALAGTDDRITLWSVTAHRVVGEPLSGHTAPVSNLGFSADGKTLASGARDRSVILWDVSDPQNARRLGDPLRAHVDYISGLSFAGNLLAVTSLDGTVSLWDVQRRRRMLAMINPGAGDETELVLSPDGRLLAWSGNDGATFWDVGTRRKTTVKGKLSGDPVAFGPGGVRLVTDSDGKLGLWDLKRGRALRLPSGVPRDATVALARDGTLATATDSAITVWSPTGDLRARTKLKESVGSLAISPDGATVAWSDEDGRVAIWHPTSGDPPKTRRLHKYWVSKIAFSPDSELLAAASADLTVSLWDAESASPIGTLVGHSDVVGAVAFSRDGKTLASGGDDSTIRFWDVETRRPIGEALSMPDSVSDVAFGPRGLVAVTDEGRVVLWDKSFWSVDFDALRGRLCGLVGASVDVTEWNQVLPGKPRPQPCAG